MTNRKQAEIDRLKARIKWLEAKRDAWSEKATKAIFERDQARACAATWKRSAKKFYRDNRRLERDIELSIRRENDLLFIAGEDIL